MVPEAKNDFKELKIEPTFIMTKSGFATLFIERLALSQPCKKVTERLTVI